MSVPKIIHYCWFGGNPKPKLAEKCIKSWKKFCPDYQIIEWNEENFDVSAAPRVVVNTERRDAELYPRTASAFRDLWGSDPAVLQQLCQFSRPLPAE